MATAVALHLGATVPNLLSVEAFDDFEEQWVRDCFPGLTSVENGTVGVPEEPGIGVSPREELLKEHPYQPVFLDLASPGWEWRQARIPAD
jgi:L-alanine-DL-glutamate epimerase-like enolase superfamily enzyme